MDAPADLLHSARTRAGLSVRALAALAGISPNTVMDIEKGRTDPGLGTLTRLLDAAGYELTGGLRRRKITPRVALADLSDKHSGDEPDWTAFRGAIDWLRQHPSELPAALHRRPRRSGRPHLDALIAAIAEKLADDAQLRRPAWTRDIPTPSTPWLPTGTPRMIARWKQNTPPQLLARNLVVDAETLWRREHVSA